MSLSNKVGATNSGTRRREHPCPGRSKFCLAVQIFDSRVVFFAAGAARRHAGRRICSRRMTVMRRSLRGPAGGACNYISRRPLPLLSSGAAVKGRVPRPSAATLLSREGLSVLSVCEGARSNQFGRGTRKLPKLFVKTHQDGLCP